MEDPRVIYLGPACQKEGDGREWCEDDVWTQCECGCSSVRYTLESDAQSELAALRVELAERKRKHLRSCQIAIGKSQLAKERHAQLIEAGRQVDPIFGGVERVIANIERTAAMRPEGYRVGIQKRIEVERHAV
jgi:hypothetical protein